LKSHGIIFGVIGIGVGIGAATGPLLTGYLFDITNSYQMAFLLCAMVSFSGIILPLFLKMERN